MARMIATQPVDIFTGRRTGPRRVRARVDPLPEPMEGPMPDGEDIHALVTWVGYSPDRAKAALVAEHDREHIRAEVTSHLDLVLRETP